MDSPWLWAGIAWIGWLILSGVRERREQRRWEREKNVAEREAQLEPARAKLARDSEAFDHLLAEKTAGFPWLAQAWADYHHLVSLNQAVALETKSHPALGA